jgi:hypothetical protein
MIVISVIMLTWLSGCNRTRQAIYWVTPALFVPILIAMVIGMMVPKGLPVKFFAVIPGVFTEQSLIRSANLSMAMFGAAAITAIVFLLAVTSIRLFLKARNAVVIVAVCLGVFSAAFVFKQ